jgi:hypothetical protein
VRISDLETVDSNTSELIGYVAYVKKADSSEVLGRVTSVHSERISLDLSVKENGVDTNVYVTVVDNEGNEHSGALFVK